MFAEAASRAEGKLDVETTESAETSSQAVAERPVVAQGMKDIAQ